MVTDSGYISEFIMLTLEAPSLVIVSIKNPTVPSNRQFRREINVLFC